MSAPASTAAASRRTPLFDLHRELGAKLIDFGGWEMPVQYSGILEEHRAVRERVGIFDVSHMGEFEVTGPGSLAFLQRLTPNDVGKLADGAALYTVACWPTGLPPMAAAASSRRSQSAGVSLARQKISKPSSAV